jgi:hypothetical protein
MIGGEFLSPAKAGSSNEKNRNPGVARRNGA